MLVSVIKGLALQTILKLQESVGNYVDKETRLRQRLIQGANDLNHLREKW